MVTGKTASGFEFEVDETIADDMEFIEALADAEDDALKFPRVIEWLLGKEQKKRFYDHVRGEAKRVPIEKTTLEFAEIMRVSGEQLKNY